MAQPKKRIPLALLDEIEVAHVDGTIYRARVRRDRVIVDNATRTAAKTVVSNSWVDVDMGASVDDYLRGEGVPTEEHDPSVVAALIISAIVGHPRVHLAGQAPRFVWSDHIALARGDDPVRAAGYSRHVHEPVADHVRALVGKLHVRHRGRLVVEAVHTAPSAEETEPDPPSPAEPSPPAPTPTPVIRERPVEEHHTDTTTYRTPEQERQLERREGPLVKAYSAHLTEKGHRVGAYDISVHGVARPYRVDLYDHETKSVIEAKWESTIEDIRMAVGQLAHYSYLLASAESPGKTVRETILVGSEPSPEIRDFLAELSIGVVWLAGGSLDGHPPAEFDGDDE